jgi:predicted ATPase with chaperone activity
VFNVVGLPDNAVRESRERVRAALRNCGFETPGFQTVTVNLAPADVRKEGSAFETTRIHSVAGVLDGKGLIGTRPFRSPHHTISDATLIGGGAIPGRGKSRWGTTVCSFWTSCRSFSATSWK